VRVLAARSTGHDLDARLQFTLEVAGVGSLGHVLAQVRQVNGVTGARRR
jgi:hypothetical protein